MREILAQARELLEQDLWKKLCEQPIEGKLQKLLKGEPDVKKFLKCLRHEIESKGYSESLERLAFISYTEVDLVTPLCLIGKALIKDQPLDKERLLKAVHHAGFTVSDRTIGYFLEHPKKIFQAYLSTRFGKLFFPMLAYDPKQAFGNYPGKFFDIDAQARVIYTPTPTRRDRLLPEAHAFLHYLAKHNQAWLYVNLQDITCRDEGPRSRHLMQQNFEYPGTFYGLTLAQDAGLYSKYNDYKKVLTDPRNFTMHSPHGYYFPARTREEERVWIQKLLFIADLALNLAKKRANPQEFKTLFGELVTLGIIKYAMSLVNKRTFISLSCKESIDRGGKMNALLYWAENEATSENFKVVFSCLHARALFVRERQIRKRRLQEAAVLLYSISHDEIKDFFKKVVE